MSENKSSRIRRLNSRKRPNEFVINFKNGRVALCIGDWVVLWDRQTNMPIVGEVNWVYYFRRGKKAYKPKSFRIKKLVYYFTDEEPFYFFLYRKVQPGSFEFIGFLPQELGPQLKKLAFLYRMRWYDEPYNEEFQKIVRNLSIAVRRLVGKAKKDVNKFPDYEKLLEKFEIDNVLRRNGRKFGRFVHFDRRRGKFINLLPYYCVKNDFVFLADYDLPPNLEEIGPDVTELDYIKAYWRDKKFADLVRYLKKHYSRDFRLLAMDLNYHAEEENRIVRGRLVKKVNEEFYKKVYGELDLYFRQKFRDKMQTMSRGEFESLIEGFVKSVLKDYVDNHLGRSLKQWLKENYGIDIQNLDESVGTLSEDDLPMVYKKWGYRGPDLKIALSLINPKWSTDEKQKIEICPISFLKKYGLKSCIDFIVERDTNAKKTAISIPKTLKLLESLIGTEEAKKLDEEYRVVKLMRGMLRCYSWSMYGVSKMMEEIVKQVANNRDENGNPRLPDILFIPDDVLTIFKSKSFYDGFYHSTNKKIYLNRYKNDYHSSDYYEWLVSIGFASALGVWAPLMKKLDPNLSLFKQFLSSVDDEGRKRRTVSAGEGWPLQGLINVFPLFIDKKVGRGKKRYFIWISPDRRYKDLYDYVNWLKENKGEEAAEEFLTKFENPVIHRQIERFRISYTSKAKFVVGVPYVYKYRWAFFYYAYMRDVPDCYYNKIGAKILGIHTVFADTKGRMPFRTDIPFLNFLSYMCNKLRPKIFFSEDETEIPIYKRTFNDLTLSDVCSLRFGCLGESIHKKYKELWGKDPYYSLPDDYRLFLINYIEREATEEEGKDWIYYHEEEWLVTPPKKNQSNETTIETTSGNVNLTQTQTQTNEVAINA